MINVYTAQNKFKPETLAFEDQNALKNALWIDLLNPTKEEEHWVEAVLGVDIPTREEMQEIELSSRLYKENSCIFMTVSMVAKSDSSAPKSDAVTLILSHNKLITIRYIEPHSFALFISRLTKLTPEECTATRLVFELLDASIERLADILEKVSHFLDGYSQMIFRPQEKNEEQPDYKILLQQVGAHGDLAAKVQESLISFNRLITFFGQSVTPPPNPRMQVKLNVLARDISSLADYVNFLSGKVNFLFDATLGMVTIEQNNIIKIFSIAAVILLPPTLVASIYGMNFHHMPELSWRFGYPFAIVCMLIAAWLPYKYFKMKKWL